MLAFDGSGNVTHRYLHGQEVDQLFADESAVDGVLCALSDRQGSVRDWAKYNSGTNATSVFNHVEFDSYGNIESQSNAGHTVNIGYTGRYYDAATGLQWNRARWYDPSTGRWMNQDLIGFASGDANLYRYVGNGPANGTDPSGLATRWYDEPKNAIGKFGKLFEIAKTQAGACAKALTSIKSDPKIDPGLNLSGSGGFAGPAGGFQVNGGLQFIYIRDTGQLVPYVYFGGGFAAGIQLSPAAGFGPYGSIDPGIIGAENVKSPGDYEGFFYGGSGGATCGLGGHANVAGGTPKASTFVPDFDKPWAVEVGPSIGSPGGAVSSPNLTYFKNPFDLGFNVPKW